MLYYDTITRLTFTAPPFPQVDGYVQPWEEVGMEESHILCFLILSDLILYYNTTTKLTFTPSPPPPPVFLVVMGIYNCWEKVGME